MFICSVCFADGLVGKVPPEITVRQWLTKNPPDLKDSHGQVRVIEFWATWCQPCVANIGHLKKLNSKYRPMGLEMIALSQDKSPQEVSRFIREKGINYHVAIDNGTVDWYGVTGYPTAVVVNHLGKVVWEGYPWKPEFEKSIRKALAAAPPPILGGVSLGPFEYLKKPLYGGRDFAKSYRKIRALMNKEQKTDVSKTAKMIVDAIDQTILQKTTEADNLRPTDPASAYHIYNELVTKYDGIEVTRAAKNKYLQMKSRKVVAAPGFPDN
jgi:thiol-disulfide isomerase/thioredoxin